MSTTNIKSVLVPYPVDRAYDYAVPEGLAVADGDYVVVPLGSRNVAGVVWGDGGADGVSPKKLKSILFKYDVPPMPDAQRKFTDWAAHYTMTQLGAFLKLSMSVPSALEPPKEIKAYRISVQGKSLFSPSPQRGEGRGEGANYAKKPSQSLRANAKDLRQHQTDAEEKLWLALRDRRFENFKFKRQVPVAQYIADFLCAEKNLIVEIDGGQHNENPDDLKRTKVLEQNGYHIIRFWNNEVLSNFEGVLQRISETLVAPSPQPSPQRGEGVPSAPNQTLSPAGRGQGEGVIKAGEGISLSPKATSVMKIAADGLARRPAELAREAGVSAGVVKTLHTKGLLEEVHLQEPPPCRRPDLDRAEFSLSSAQKKAADFLRRPFSSPAQSASPPQAGGQGGERMASKPVLLDGVTGSGKTEVYFEAIASVLKNNQQALILLPEIALSNAFLSRFKERFGCAPALWHSSLSDHQRKITWRGVASGESRVVVGARSALFLPYKDLGMIVVDEEHDPAYKQEEGVIYNARDMAVVRAHMGKIPVVLVSATPSLETMQNVWLGKYEHLQLPDRHFGAGMPDIHLIDLKKDKPDKQHFIAPTLVEAIKTAVDEESGQALLFLNRRGYAPLTLCRTCGHRFECPRCSAWLVEHKKTNKLHCHHCDYDLPIPAKCPTCNDEDSLVPCGPGVERILEEVKELFPGKRTAILSSDTTTTHEQLNSVLNEIRDHKIDIIIGTQIIAKGHHFPKLTCVGIIDADLGLAGGDLRASERTFQLLHQVAGRAGREEDKGYVYLQTYNPESRVMQALAKGDRDDFLEIEAAQREAASMPPFTRLAGIIVSGRDEGSVIALSKQLGQSAPFGQGLQTLGPADAPMYRLRGKFRRRLLVRADKTIDLQKAIEHWISSIKIPSTLRVQIDIDPQSFF